MKKADWSVKILLGVVVGLCGEGMAFAGSYKVYSSYLWHLQQPIYWPEKVSGLNRYQFAYESLSGSPTYPGHPQNNLSDIFGLDDRKAAYQYRTRDSVAAMSGQPDGGAQLSYAGSLIENVWSLGDHNSLGYGPTWYASIREARGWKTTRNRSKLEPVGFAYHHAFMPLIDKDARRKEIAINQDIWWKAWVGSDTGERSYGFRCSEEAFSERIIKDVVDAGYTWVIVPNHHLSRTHPNYVQLHGKGLYDPPNKADQNNAVNSGGWYSGEIDGRGSTESLPFSFQPHWVKYVDPTNGAEYKIIAVPMTDLGSYRDGYSQQGIDILNMLNGYASHDRPCIALFSHDGDNAWGGGFSYYQEAVPNFVNSAGGAGYRPTTIQTFLDENPPPESDLVHIEDGAWFNAADDWGHPMYVNWLWPPQRDRRSPAYVYSDPATYADITNGWAEDFRNWAVIMAAQNFVSTAEQIYKSWNVTNQVLAWKIQEPVQRNGTDNGANAAELAWHFFLGALDSGYMYYGAAIDMEVKPSLAGNKAIEYANQILSGHLHQDALGPTVFIPQRYPYNPGATNYGAIFGYRQWIAPSDFHVWTFAYDVNGVTSVVLKVRADYDGFNPVDNNDNETYAGGASVGPWSSWPMNVRLGSTFVSNIFNSGEINFFIMPTAIADEYWAYVTGYNNQLLDYYVEAYDGRGNVTRTDIQHVFVGSQGGGVPVTFTPAAPRDCDQLVTRYNATTRSLSNASPVYLKLTFDNFATGASNYPMAASGAKQWVVTNAIPAGATNAIVYFSDTAGAGGVIDNNSGANWAVGISACASSRPSAVSFNPSAPDGCDDILITYSPNDGPLKTATNIYIHVGRNLPWQDVTDVLMARQGTNWVYTNRTAYGTYRVNCVFHNGVGLWDNNYDQDWYVAVANCSNPVAFSPVQPEDCGVLTVNYDSSHRVLNTANPVHMVLTFSGHFAITTNKAMTGVMGGVWTGSNSIPGGAQSASVYFENASGTTKDGEANPWATVIFACSTNPTLSSVAWTPTNPVGCDPVVITYLPGNGPLANATGVYIHVGRNGWRDVITPAPAMARYGASWIWTNNLLPGTEVINVCFNDGAGVWDNNYAQDWAKSVDNCSGGVTQSVYFAPGTPTIHASTGAMNYVGEAFDMNLAGGDAVTVDQGGFGSFGHVYLNYDASNLYIGGIGANVSGSETNNAMALFLALNTLTDNAENFWYIFSRPNGLSNMHNLAFTPPVDIAILLGDQWGDGTFPEFNLANGYDFGQGVFYTATGGFWTVGGARLAQFNGVSTNPVTDSYDPARVTTRWICSIPWSSLNAPQGIGSISNCHLSGVLANSSVNGSDRYLSGNYLGLTATNNAARDEWNNFAFTFVTLTGLPIGKLGQDSNQNGIPDDWETRYFGSATGAVASADSDNDGFTNLEEYWLNTNPRSAASRLIVESCEYPTNPGSRVTWQTVGGKTYHVDVSTNLLGVPIFTNLATVTETGAAEGVGSTETYVDAAAVSNTFRAYRIRFEP